MSAAGSSHPRVGTRNITRIYSCTVWRMSALGLLYVNTYTTDLQINPGRYFRISLGCLLGRTFPNNAKMNQLQTTIKFMISPLRTKLITQWPSFNHSILLVPPNLTQYTQLHTQIYTTPPLVCGAWISVARYRPKQARMHNDAISLPCGLVVVGVPMCNRILLLLDQLKATIVSKSPMQTPRLGNANRNFSWRGNKVFHGVLLFVGCRALPSG